MCTMAMAPKPVSRTLPPACASSASSHHTVKAVRLFLCMHRGLARVMLTTSCLQGVPQQLACCPHSLDRYNCSRVLSSTSAQCFVVTGSDHQKWPHMLRRTGFLLALHSLLYCTSCTSQSFSFSAFLLRTSIHWSCHLLLHSCIHASNLSFIHAYMHALALSCCRRQSEI